MTPLPKSKHSTRRKGVRIATKTLKFSNLVKCQNCGKPKLPHRICKHCAK